MKNSDDYYDGYADGIMVALRIIQTSAQNAIKEIEDKSPAPVNIAFPEPADPLGYTRKEVTGLIRKHRPTESYDSFLTWMRGQTIAIGEDERDRYYPADVRHFINEGPTAVVVD